jgi:threonine dehydratase
LSEELGREGPVDRWRRTRDRIHAEVCSEGWSDELGSFTQAYGGSRLDASLLLLPQVGFLPAEDPRIRGTLEAVRRELAWEGFLLRYRSDARVDGLPAGEGAFLACSFWLVDALALDGRLDEAAELFERLLAVRNDVGLRAEDYDPSARRLLGNFPQAFSHIALVNSAFHLADISSRGAAAGSRPVPAAHGGRRVVTTPLEPAPDRLARGWPLYLKREDVHELGAFKWRGALPVLESFQANGADAVVTASTGNHGAATAWAAARLGLRAIVYAPVGASRAKVAHLERLGAGLRLAGADLEEAKELARAEAAAHGLPFFEDGAEPAQYEGYAAIGDELLDQLGVPPGAVVVPVGNGALLGGVGRAVRRRSPGTLRTGVVAAAAPVMADSWEAGRSVEGASAATFADGLAVRVAIPYAVQALREVATHMFRVSEREIASALAAFAGAGIRVEGGAAASLAALPQLPEVGGPIVLVLTGRNIDDDVFAWALSHGRLRAPRRRR